MNSYTWNLLILMQNYYCFHNEKITIKATKQTLRQKFSVFVDGRTELYVFFINQLASPKVNLGPYLMLITIWYLLRASVQSGLN